MFYKKFGYKVLVLINKLLKLKKNNLKQNTIKITYQINETLTQEVQTISFFFKFSQREINCLK